MSIEQNIADLTAAVNNLTAVLQSERMAGNSAAKGPEMTATEVKQRVEEYHAKKDPKAAAASAAPPAGTPATPATTAAASGTIDFTANIQKPIVAMGASGAEGRAKALGILKELGAGRASEIKPEDYARAVELIAKAA